MRLFKEMVFNRCRFLIAWSRIFSKRCSSG
ncbi:hypothetical protein LIQ96_05255 [Lacticaseibacillus paracasei]|nr:hypothetical protein [Lacticaseibacillus paracasei]